MITTWAWVAVIAFIAAVLALDLLVFNRDAHVVSMREAAAWVAVWFGLGIAYGLILWAWLGSELAGQYFAGYLVEQSLSVDNMFVFVLIFTYFSVPSEYQHRVLFWGIIGALGLRAVFIFAGAELLEHFHWIIYVFGGFLLFTAARMLRGMDEDIDPEHNFLLKLLRRRIEVTPEYRGQSFLVKENGKRMATPLFAVLVVIIPTDVIFAVDSIPAIFAITTNTFIVFTSNAFAVLGLRSMFFLLQGLTDRFEYIKYGLAVILAFVGLKMLFSDVYHVPVALSLAIIATTLGVTGAISWRVTAGRPAIPPAAGNPEITAKKPNSPSDNG